ncbi:MAG TPA: hypothetical protein VMR21_11860 [Vicinamibacteria bacterium]|nr:hypothetical protein [Vicinamibacteria bacterium]
MAREGGLRGRSRGKERRNERKRRRADDGPLARRRAYRAAREVLEQGLVLWKIADRKARVAVMLLVPLIVVLVLLLAQPGLFEPIPVRLRIGVVMAVILYTGLAVAMFHLAIGALRPEGGAPVSRARSEPGPDRPLGIRHFDDILRHDLEDYRRAWREVRIGQLVAEVAEQSHAVAFSNRRKYRTLYRLFRGLEAMTALAVLLLLATGMAVYLARLAG